jgi:predicted RNA-binding Zn ribbon-like protein
VVERMSLGDHLLAGQIALDDYAAGAAFTTDLVNTVDGLRAGDTLRDVRDLRALLDRHDALAAAEALGEDDVRALRDVRTRLLDALRAPDDRRAVAALDALLEAPRHVVRLVGDATGNHRTWAVALRPEQSLAQRLQVISTISLLGVLKTLSAARFRSCAAPDCSGVFVDTTRAGQRKYCQPGVCGNRQNVAAYRARRIAQH